MNKEESKAAVLARLIGKPGDQNHAALVSGFLKRADTLTKTHADGLNDEEARQALKDLRDAYRDYRREDLARLQAAIPASKKEHTDAGTIKSKATSILRGVYKALLELLLCERNMNLTIESIRQEITALGGDPKAALKIPATALSSDLPIQVAVAIKRRGVLNAEIARMQKMESIVGMIEAVLNYVELSVSELMTPEKAKPVLNDFTKLFRKMKFPQAHKLLAETAQQETGRLFMRKKKFKRGRWKFILEVTDILIALAEKFKADLRSSGEDIFLKKDELRKALEHSQKQISITVDFLEKYRIPEIRMRLDALQRQREKIGAEVGTLQTYHALIEEIERGCAAPMMTLKEVNDFEAGPFKQANITIEKKSVEIQKFLEFIREKGKNPDPEAVSESDMAGMKLKTD